MGSRWCASDFIDLLDAHDLPEAVGVVGAWWEGLAGDGYACGMMVEVSGGDLWYLEALCLEGQDPLYARPVKARRPWVKPMPKLYVTRLSWHVETAVIQSELDVIYCRGG